MILNYKDPRVKRLYEGEDIKAWSAVRRQAEKRLRILDSADRLETLMLLPSNRFESLHGDRRGTLVTKAGADRADRRTLGDCRFVALVGRHGWPEGQ